MCILSWLNSKLAKLENRVINIESQSRRDSLLIDGVIESNHDNFLQKLKDLFIHKLKLDAEMVESLKFVRIHRCRPINKVHRNLKQ